MTPLLLIGKSDFAKYADLSINLNEEKKLIQHINNAQELDVKILLGEKMYYDMLSKIKSYNASVAIDANYEATENEQKYLDLLNGKEYVLDEVTINFQGLKPVLVYFTNARYLPTANIQPTATGNMMKLNQYSEHIDSKTRANMIQSSESTAIAYFQSVKQYLSEHTDIYTFWKNDCSTGTKRSGARITSVGYGRR